MRNALILLLTISNLILLIDHYTDFDPNWFQLKEEKYQKRLRSRRKFVSYHSSAWEQLWLDHIEEWGEKRTVCEELTHNQTEFVHDFLNVTCTGRFLPPYQNWCVVDDASRPMYYDTSDRKQFVIHFDNPLPPSAKVVRSSPQPVLPSEQHRNVMSYFVFVDEFTGEKFVEYIEPLVSHLRWPLFGCIEVLSPKGYCPGMHRGYVVPPPPSRWYRKAVYYDAGSSSWSDGFGGPSLSYFWRVWKRHSITFDEIYAYELATAKKDFKESLPDGFHEFVHYQQCELVSQPSEETDEKPFVPGVISREASKEDYILFKLDIDQPAVEVGNIEYILNDPNNVIDEVAWEHHIRGNYLMPKWGKPEDLPDVSLHGSYQLFLRMRQKGIRAHSWV